MMLHDKISIAVEPEGELFRAFAYNKDGWCIAQEKRETKEEAIRELYRWLGNDVCET